MSYDYTESGWQRTATQAMMDVHRLCGKYDYLKHLVKVAYSEGYSNGLEDTARSIERGWEQSRARVILRELESTDN